MRQYRFFWHRSVVALPIAILFGMVLRLPFAYAQDIAVETLDELQAIRFEGCVRTQPADLLGVLSSRESELSFTRQLAKYYYENVRLNPSTPQGVLGTLATVEKDLANELRYFSEEKANSDSLALLIYLWQNGFHNAKVDWSFTTGSTFAKNTLTFRITEGEQAIIDTFLVVGLDSVARRRRLRQHRARLAHPQVRSVRGGLNRFTRRSSSRMKRPAPSTITESARLKVGQCQPAACRSTKSTTAPMVTRSIKFPSAPSLGVSVL